VSVRSFLDRARSIDFASYYESAIQAIRRTLYFGLDARVDLYHLLAGISRAGMALPPALAQIAAEHLRQGNWLGRALYAIQRPLKSGKSYEQAFKPWIPFDELTILAAADRNASTEAFTSLATIGTALRQIKASLLAAGAYPLLLTFAAFASMRGLYTDFVKPSVSVMDITKLPEATRNWMKVVTVCAQHPMWIAMAARIVMGLVAYSLPRVTGKPRQYLDRYFPPYVVYREICAARFLLAFVGLQMAKTPVAESLRLLSTNASPYMRSLLEPMHVSARSGATDVSTFRSPLLDPSVSVTLALLLQTQDAEAALPRIADTLLASTQRRVGRLAGFISAGGILIIAVFVGWTLVAFNDFGNVAANISNATTASP
jgi:type II secretory pathway component PulF